MYNRGVITLASTCTGTCGIISSTHRYMYMCSSCSPSNSATSDANTVQCLMPQIILCTSNTLDGFTCIQSCKCGDSYSYTPYLLPIINVLEKIVDRQVEEFLVTIVRFLPCHGAVCILRSLPVLASPCDMRRELGVFG